MVVWSEILEQKWMNSRCILNTESMSLTDGFEMKVKRGGAKRFKMVE